MSIHEKLEEALQLAELEGLPAESTEVQFRITKIKVDECQMHYAVSSCGDCEHNDDCATLQYFIQLSALRLQKPLTKLPG